MTLWRNTGSGTSGEAAHRAQNRRARTARSPQCSPPRAAAPPPRAPLLAPLRPARLAQSYPGGTLAAPRACAACTLSRSWPCCAAWQARCRECSAGRRGPRPSCRGRRWACRWRRRRRACPRSAALCISRMILKLTMHGVRCWLRVCRCTACHAERSVTHIPLSAVSMQSRWCAIFERTLVQM